MRNIYFSLNANVELRCPKHKVPRVLIPVVMCPEVLKSVLKHKTCKL